MASKSKSDSKKVVVDDVTGTNRVMIIVGIVVLITFIIVMFQLNNSSNPDSKPVIPSGVKKVVVEFEIENRGKIQMELRNDLMPKTTDNFVRNIIDGYYVSKKFFRSDNYMVSAGSPNNQAGYDNANPMPLETNSQLNVERYYIGMSKDTKANLTSRSIFFVAKAKEASFNGKYAVFGKIANVDSEKVLDSIKKDDAILSAKVLTYDDKPYVAAVATPE